MNLIRRFFGQPINIGKRFIILGMDGLDPGLIQNGISNGNLPNFKRLANMGGFSELKTTWMPLSPVAWSSFISGCNPGRHGIFDFLHRDPDKYEPFLSIAQQQQPPRELEIGSYKLPLASGRTKKGRKGPAFWTETSKQGIRTNVIRCPTSFPPEPVRGKMLSGLGVPDLNGTQGSFTFFTSNTQVDQNSRGGEINIIEHPGNEACETNIMGPPNPFLTDESRSTIPLELEVSDDVLRGKVEDTTFTLEVEQWSDWIPVSFDFLGPISAEGQIRFFFNNVNPEFELYCSPVNISSSDPPFPISYPENFSNNLTNKIGRFHTLGLTADTGMLKENRVDNVAFLEQTSTVLDERINMLKEELSEFDDGVFNLVFDIPDRIQHMFWRYIDSDHAALDTDSEANTFEGVIRSNYQKMDEILGWVLDQMSDEDEIVVCSDHGFNSFRREVDLNTWLVQEGFMTLQDGTSPRDTGTLFKGVNWNKTQAYALGMSGIYLNVKDREKHGIVSSDDIPELLTKIGQKLTSLIDQSEDMKPVSRVKPALDVYHGNQTEKTPDLLVGYNNGYRISWDSVLGGMSGQIFSDNTNAWSGDHCLDPELIPGSLLTSFSFDNSADIGLWDIMPGVFKKLDIDSDANFDGSSDWI